MKVKTAEEKEPTENSSVLNKQTEPSGKLVDSRHFSCLVRHVLILGSSYLLATEEQHCDITTLAVFLVSFPVEPAASDSSDGKLEDIPSRFLSISLYSLTFLFYSIYIGNKNSGSYQVVVHIKKTRKFSSALRPHRYCCLLQMFSFSIYFDQKEKHTSFATVSTSQTLDRKSLSTSGIKSCAVFKTQSEKKRKYIKVSTDIL